MKKLVVILVFGLYSCKTGKHKCDAYSNVEYDIHKIQLESGKKYTSTYTIK